MSISRAIRKFRNCLLKRAHVSVMVLYSITVGLLPTPSLCDGTNVRGLELQTDSTTQILNAEGLEIATHLEPHFGHAVELQGSSTSALHLGTKLYMSGGTISFWVKPHWGPNSPESHTFMSARWNDSRQSYLAISEGWWEPSGRGRLYFIVSNEDIMHCSSETQLPTETWSLITVTWASGTLGFCNLYVDDVLRAKTQHLWPGLSTTDGIELGTDRAASDNRGRTAQATIAGLKILSHPVTQRDIIQRYTAEEDASALYTKKWAWLDIDDKSGTVRPAAKTPAAHFTRAIFDEDSAWATDQKTIDERLRRISRAGFNVYVPCIWHGRGTLYPSDIAPPDGRFKNRLSQGWDPLAYLISHAHALKIAVFPWFTVVRREDKAHPEWAERGTPDGAFDVHSSGFRDFAVKLMLDVVARYEVDGINLDYIRAMGVCTSEFCQHDYLKRAGKALLADYAGGSPDAVAWQRIQVWQDDAVGELVQNFATRARALRPGLLIAVDGNALNPGVRRSLEGRDEISWANRNWVDVFFNMDYRPEFDLAAVNAARSRLIDADKIWLLVGNYDLVDGVPESRSGEWLSKVVAFAQDVRKDRGVGVYLYGQLSEEQIESLRLRSVAPTQRY